MHKNFRFGQFARGWRFSVDLTIGNPHQIHSRSLSLLHHVYRQRELLRSGPSHDLPAMSPPSLRERHPWSKLQEARVRNYRNPQCDIHTDDVSPGGESSSQDSQSKLCHYVSAHLSSSRARAALFITIVQFSARAWSLPESDETKEMESLPAHTLDFLRFMSRQIGYTARLWRVPAASRELCRIG